MTESDDVLDRALSAIDDAGDPVREVKKLTWVEYTNGQPIFDNLIDIRGFSLLLDLAPLPELADRAKASNLATSMHGVVLRSIQEAGFYQEDSLSLQSDAATAAVVYGDDRYDFAVQVTHSPERGRQGQLGIQRSGSRFEDFHSWFVAMAGQFPEMVRGILALLRDLTSREVTAFRAAYQFRFLLHEFRRGDARRLVRNSEVMQNVIRGVPDDGGTLSEADEVIASAGRIDTNLSRWIQLGERWRLERYGLEAPANKEGAGLWLQFSYNGETYTLGETRARFELDPFLGEGGVAYVRFLRDKALVRFLSSLLRDVSFRSSTDTLP